MPIATKVVCFSRLLKCFRSLYGKQCGHRSDCSYIGAVCSGSTLFASILNSSVMLDNYLQQTTSADDIFRCIFFLGALRVNAFHAYQIPYFCLLPSGYLIVCFVYVSVCASVQLEMHRPENTNKITDVRALTCSTFYFIFNFHCFFI